jgi:glycogen phosphorylase
MSDIRQPDGASRSLTDARVGLDPAAIAQGFCDHLACTQAKFPAVATRHDHYMALACTIRDRLLHRQTRTAHGYFQQRSRSVCYLSAEFLMGPQLGNNLVNLGIYDEAREAMRLVGLDLEALLEEEDEPGLGNGGLGRLAACFLDSLATLGVPSISYGVRYEFGIFNQAIRDGWQVELTDKWLRLGNPWEVPRPEIVFDVKFGGRTEHHDEDGVLRVRWIPHQVVRGMAYDTPIVGYHADTVNLLRLWKAEAAESFDFQAFNTGNYYGAVLEKVESENITKVLYPNDGFPQGRQLRLQQQYFFVSCALQDMIRIYLQRASTFDELPDKFVVQLNDTHPAIAVAELMRLLVDEHGQAWEPAWEMTQAVMGYTNHTLMPEALERWPVELFGRVLPRHLEIVYEINRRFLNQVRRDFPGDDARVRRLSIIDESAGRYVRMAHLACVGSHSINGVARLHSELLASGVLRDFHEVFPERFGNTTNGVTPRRFLALSNPRLADLITQKLGGGWVTRLEDLRRLEPYADDPAFRAAWQQIKRQNKMRLARLVRARTGVDIDVDTLFDVQVKRLHEYKRQLLNVLHVITLYNRGRRDPSSILPRTCLFGGKAAPGYLTAKLIIKLINSVAEVVNAEPALDGRLKVVFFPNFNVKHAHSIYPGAELSEQISTAGLEASGTGNMKFAMNGALTVGTLDGANIEIREEVGAENFFLFGLTAAEVLEMKSRGYRPRDVYETDAELREAIDQIAGGNFSPESPGLFQPLVDALLTWDEYMLLADYRSYVDCQEDVSRAYRDRERWTRMSILNVARIGRFSSDRSISEYCRDIWNISLTAGSGSTANGGVPRSGR